MSGWLDFEIARERRRELLQEADRRRLARKLRETGYRRRVDGWYSDTSRLLEDPTALPTGGWRRALALLGVSTVPFFRAFRS